MVQDLSFLGIPVEQESQDNGLTSRQLPQPETMTEEWQETAIHSDKFPNAQVVERQAFVSPQRHYATGSLETLIAVIQENTDAMNRLIVKLSGAPAQAMAAVLPSPSEEDRPPPRRRRRRTPKPEEEAPSEAAEES